jgi:hypothetical protein
LIAENLEGSKDEINQLAAIGSNALIVGWRVGVRRRRKEEVGATQSTVHGALHTPAAQTVPVSLLPSDALVTPT